MSEDTEGARVYLFEGLKLKQAGLFDFSELYKGLFKWFEVHDYDFYEKEYVKTDTARGEDLTLKWEANKEEDYVKYVIEIDFMVLGMRNVEVEKDGLKLKTNQADVEIQLSAYLILDYGGSMNKKFGNIGRNFYEKRLAKDRIDQHEITLYNDSHMFIDEIKAFLSMHKF
tara:strand:- start:303 stop:812 length:510 start_codon:yes stop_codon:yes gene_type:complete